MFHLSSKWRCTLSGKVVKDTASCVRLDGSELFDSWSILTLDFAPFVIVHSFLDSFLMGDEENNVSLDTGTGDTFDLKIRCYKMAHDKVGTAFPEATAHYD